MRSMVSIQQDLDLAVNLLLAALNQNKPVMDCGNGADSQHISGELVGRFFKEGRALNVRSLYVDASVITE